MKAREKQTGAGGGRPPHAQGSWLAGLVIGLTVGNLAAQAMMMGTGAAIQKAIAEKALPKLGG
jgi:hypothetical protein